MRGRIFGLAAVLASGFGLGAGAAEPQLVTHPDWVQRPRAEDLDAAFPKVATALGLGGRASIACKVASDGRLTLCKVRSEAPLGLGFGKAEVSMSPLFQMRPMTVGGKAVGGADVVIPMAFHFPERPPSDPLSSARDADPRALALARRMLKVMEKGRSITERFDDEANRLELLDDDVTPLQTRAAAGAALRTAAAAHAAEAEADAALAMASVYTAVELAPAVSFLESPLSAPARPNADLNAVKTMINRDSRRRLRVLTRRTYCASHDCDPSKVALVESGAEIEMPTFVQAPSQDEVLQVRPPILDYIPAPAAARLRCHATVDGGLADCLVVAESPAGLGWGAAAASLAPKFRLAPVLMLQGAAGETVGVTIALPVEALSEPFTGPAARSRAALELGRQYVEADDPFADAIADTAKDFPELDGGRAPAGADPAIYKAAVEMVLQLSQQVRADSREQYAQTYGALFTLDQLRASTAFERTTGHALAAKEMQVGKALSKVGAALDAEIRSDARAAYCKDFPCDAQPPPRSGAQ